MESDDDDWLNDFDEPAGEKETTKEMNGGGRGDNGEGERGGMGDERRDGEESHRQRQREHQFYYQNHSSEQSQMQSQQQEQQQQQQEYYHNLHNQNSNQNYQDATFDANAPSPIVKTAVKKDIAAAASVSRYAEETPPPKMNGYIDDYDNGRQNTSLTPASYLGTMTPKNENYSYTNTNIYDNRNDNKVTERPSSASKPSEDTVDDWLNEETAPIVQPHSYIQQQGGEERGAQQVQHQEQQNHQRDYHSQAASSSTVVQNNSNFNGLFAGNDDDAAFFDTLGNAEEPIAAAAAEVLAPPLPVPAQPVEDRGVGSMASTAAPAVDDDFLNDFAEVSNPSTHIYPPSEAAVAPIPPPSVTQPAVQAYEPPSEYGVPQPRMFTPPPPASISNLPMAQEQVSHPVPPQATVAYEPPSDFGAPPPVAPQAAVAYEPPSDFGAPPPVAPQAAVAYEPPSDFGAPPPIIPPQQNQPQQFQQYSDSSYVSNSSMHARARPGTARSPDGKPPYRCIAFGFGGALATVSQTHENTFSLCAHSVHDMLRSSDDFSARDFVEVASDETFFLNNSDSGTNNESLCSRCEHLANNASGTMGESELWRLLSLFLSRKKTFDSLRSFGEAAFKAEVANVLHIQNRADGSSSLTTTSASERDASPAILLEIERQISIGNAIAALDIAHSHKLWNVAVKVARLTRDETIISDTCLRAIQETMQVGTPLRVLELLSIGRADVAVKDVIARNNENVTLSEKWREAIAMVSLNSSERDKTITNGLIALGDAFRENNYLGIAHLCYLLSGEVWPNDTKRIRLIGSNESPCRDPRAYHRSLIAERIMLSSAESKGGEALKASLLTLIPHQRMKVCYCVLLADLGHFHVALATLKNVQKNLKLVRDDSRIDSGESVNVILAEATDLEKRIREKLGQGVIKGKIANVGKKIAGGLSRFVGGTVDALFGGDDGDVIGSHSLDTPPDTQQFHKRSSSQDTAFQHQRYGSNSSLESMSNQPPPQQNLYHQHQPAAYESVNHSRSHSLASLDEHGSSNNTGEIYPSSSQMTYSGQQQQQQQQQHYHHHHQHQQHQQQQQQQQQQQKQQEQTGVPFKLVKSFSKLFSAAVPAPDKPYEGPKVSPQETAGGLPENTFYYDENLKQWVDKSSTGTQSAAAAEAPPPLAPPPTMAPGVDYYRSGGIPNSLGANVGARYVSTFTHSGEGQRNFQQNGEAHNNEFQEMRLE